MYLATNVDADLAALCGDSQCAVKFAMNRQAPALLDYLADEGKVDAPQWNPDSGADDEVSGCHGAHFETWAFWLYAFVGQLSQDRDLAMQGVNVDTQATVGPFVLPTRPFASLYLGHSSRRGISTKPPSYISRGLFSTRRHTFVRNAAVRGDGVPLPAPMRLTQKNPSSHATGDGAQPSLRQVKRKRLDDLLEGFR